MSAPKIKKSIRRGMVDSMLGGFIRYVNTSKEANAANRAICRGSKTSHTMECFTQPPSISPTEYHNEMNPHEITTERSLAFFKDKDKAPKQQDTVLNKVFNFLLSEIGKKKEQALRSEVVHIPVEAFVEAGIFTNTANAYNGLKKALIKLDDLNYLKNRLGIEIDLSDQNHIKMFAAPYFRALMIKDGEVLVLINVLNANDFGGVTINWERILNQFSPTPPQIYELSKLAHNVLYQITYLGRLKAQKNSISKNNQFDIKVKTLVDNLSLNNRRVKEKVLSPLEAAFREINETAESQKFHDLRIKWNWEGMTSQQIIKDGVITVKVHGQMHDILSNIPTPKKPLLKEPKTDSEGA